MGVSSTTKRRDPRPPLPAPTESMDESGIYIRLVTTGMLFRLPPVPEAFEPAEPGEYRLRSTGEIVTNPDFVAIWTVQAALPDLRNDYHGRAAVLGHLSPSDMVRHAPAFLLSIVKTLSEVFEQL